MKQKRQMRLYDIYSYLVDGVFSNIEHVFSYKANYYNDKMICLYVEYDDNTSENYILTDYKDKKDAIKRINKYIKLLRKQKKLFMEA